MTRTPRRTFAVMAALVIVLSGCATGPGATGPVPTNTNAAPQVPLADLNILDAPKEYVGPSTAVLQQSDIIPVGEFSQALPATVTSHDAAGDVPVTISDTSAVIALDLAGSIAATVWGLGFGDTLVGRDISTTFPGTETLPVVTSGGHSVNAESLLALRPTVVITDGTIGPRDVIEQLRDAGIAVVFVENRPAFDGAGQLAHQISAIFGAPEAGEALADQLTEQIDAKKAEIAAIAPSDPADKVRILFLYIRGGSGVYYLFGEESGADQLIDALGAIDVAGEIGWTGMKPMTDEAMIAASPDLILVMTGGLASAGGPDGLIATKAAVGLTPAGQHSRFVDMADGDILSFGPRSAGILDALARAVYAPDSVAG